jgi:hypothetical protein
MLNWHDETPFVLVFLDAHVVVFIFDFVTNLVVSADYELRVIAAT